MATGITPAYAGKSRSLNNVVLDCPDHPRIRGEKCIKDSLPSDAPGSPPHTRGKAVFVLLQEVIAGITPAYAGKSRCCEIRPDGVRDHPRIRGEKVLRLFRLGWLLGSPPHTRGKAHAAYGVDGAGGITPAYAGKSTKPTRCGFCD